MTPTRPVYVVGGSHSTFLGRGHPDFVWRKHPDFGTRDNPGVEEHLATALQETWALTGVAPQAIDKVYVANFLGELFLRQGHLGALLPRVERGLSGKPIARVEAACASGSVAIAGCVDALQAGCDVALAVGVEIETVGEAMDGVDHMAAAAHVASERGHDRFLFPWLFARRAKAYKEAFGATSEDLGRVAVKAYANASRNPKAQMRTVSMTLEEARATSERNREFLDDEVLRPHIRLSDCTTFSDGASAVVLATQEGLYRLGIHKELCTQIRAIGHTVQPMGAVLDPRRMSNMAHAASIAYGDASITAADVDVAEVHDCFTIAELQITEALGLAELGQGAHLLRDGATALDGSVPVNTGGGLLGFGHPVGATGVKQTVEIWRQMKGHAGDYQLDRTLTHGVTANVGGDDRTAIVMVHRNVT
ncbi:MAG: hypothetical protein KTR31_26565 [Myxococcales bacterium]|nr:hypothetical protein [Myxococcales bacterium]